MKSELSELTRDPCNDRFDVCSPGEKYRIDDEIRLCVCNTCGQVWAEDVDQWELIRERLLKLTTRLNAASSSMKNTISKIDEVVSKLNLTNV